MTSPTFSRPWALLLGATIMMVAACGGSGLATKGSGNDAGLATGGRGGQNSSTTSSGGTTPSTSSQGGALSSVFSSSAGNPRSSGGVFSTSSRNGGTISSSESSSDVGGKIVSPREPILHRPQATSCEGVFAPPEPVDTSSSSSCTKHADCAAGKNGRCWRSGVGWYGVRPNCYYDTCATDADCDPGKACYCSPNTPAQCFYSGNCLTDADCGADTTGYCSPASGSDCRGYHPYRAYYCHTPKDTCIEDRDCTGQDYCDYNVVSGRWECTPPNMMCAIG